MVTQGCSIRDAYSMFGVAIPVSEARNSVTLKYMSCTKQIMWPCSSQKLAALGKLMAEVSMYDPSMLIWLDETGGDGHDLLSESMETV